MSFLDSHGDGCKPLEPCKNCQVAAFLKRKLDSSSFQLLRELCAQGVEAQTSQVSLDTPLKEIEHYGTLSVRAQNVLHNARIDTVRVLVSTSSDSLLRIPNFGRRSLNEVKLFLESCGYHLSLDPAV